MVSMTEYAALSTLASAVTKLVQLAVETQPSGNITIQLLGNMLPDLQEAKGTLGALALADILFPPDEPAAVEPAPPAPPAPLVNLSAQSKGSVTADPSVTAAPVTN